MMDSLDDFSRRIEAELAAGEQNIPSENVPQYMAQIAVRHAQFGRIAAGLLSGTIRPRMEILATHFSGAKFGRSDDPYCCELWFGYSLRCPASLRLQVALGHDEQIERVALTYELEILPSFIKYDRHDRLVMPLESVDEAQVATWLEAQLLAFVRTYLRLEHVNQDQNEVLVTDPVCGMRINRTDAAASAEYQGHPFYFCSPTCRSTFQSSPLEFILPSRD